MKRHLNWYGDSLLVVLIFCFRFAKNYMSKKNVRGGWSGYWMVKIGFHQFQIKSWWDPIKNLDPYYKPKSSVSLVSLRHLFTFPCVCVHFYQQTIIFSSNILMPHTSQFYFKVWERSSSEGFLLNVDILNCCLK